MESAPTSVAILLLQTHRLLFVREVPNSPSKQQFGSTFKYFMKQALVEYWNSVYESRRHAAENVSKKQLREETPVPEVSVVPMIAKNLYEIFLTGLRHCAV